MPGETIVLFVQLGVHRIRNFDSVGIKGVAHDDKSRCDLSWLGHSIDLLSKRQAHPDPDIVGKNHDQESDANMFGNNREW